MQLRRFEQAAEFYEQAESFLLAHEAEHCLMLGICSTLIKNNTYLYPPYLAYVEDEGKIVAVVMRTPPHNLILSNTFDERAIPMIADDVHKTYETLVGVMGSKAVSKDFAERWTAITGQPNHLNMLERTYRLTNVIPVNGVSGDYAPASEAHRELLVQWFIDFSTEALDGMSREDAERQVDLRLTRPPELGGLRLWIDEGKGVSFAGYGGLTPNGIRIGPVYTPPELRGKGYASACVAALSQEMLDMGRKFCFLFTDLKNPTSNHIYQNIGYEPVSDVDEYRFGSVG